MEDEAINEQNNYPKRQEINKVPDYVIELYQNLLLQQEWRGYVFGEIIGYSKYGFKIKSNGLYGTLPIKMLPWRYGMWKVWHHFEESLVGVIFRCKVIETAPHNFYLNLYFDARAHRYPRIIIEKGQEIKARIVHTRKTTFFVEFGDYFNWKYGSLISRIYKNNIPSITKWGEEIIGKELTLYFKETSTNGQFVLLPTPFVALQLSRESLLWYKDMIHPITMHFDQNGERSYWVHGKFPALFLKKSNKIETAPTPEQKAYLASLENGDVFECRIIGKPKKHSHFIVVLPL